MAIDDDGDLDEHLGKHESWAELESVYAADETFFHPHRPRAGRDAPWARGLHYPRGFLVKTP